ncbi:HNH endonuclease signature motif containing protein, partial [Microbacterium sp.]|uniref:HNH endonuclease signature motif containing protein n=1 Tax=Microbacterium sp. TaxID=51671 RepID=UPI002810DD4D
ALLPHASVTSPGRLRRLARRELERHLDRPLAERHRQARERRGVSLTELDDGCSRLVADVPTALGLGILDRLTQMAKILARAGRAGGARVSADARGAAGDSRTFDQLRADLLCDLLLTGEPTGAPLAGIRADVSIVVPAPVLTEPHGMHRRRATGDARDHEEPAGGGAARAGAGREAERAVARSSSGAPVDPGTARLLAERASSWTRLFADPLTGHVTAVDTYTPSAQMRKLLRARDQHCRWPGCTQRAMRCDVDHTIPWAEGGPTELGNLATS